MWFVYILRCKDNSLYTGVTVNLLKRFQEHQSGRGAAYTRSHKPVSIVYTEPCKDKSLALKRELQIKKLPKLKKELLIENV